MTASRSQYIKWCVPYMSLLDAPSSTLIHATRPVTKANTHRTTNESLFKSFWLDFDELVTRVCV